jgi:hypothetical protein
MSPPRGASSHGVCRSCSRHTRGFPRPPRPTSKRALNMPIGPDVAGRCLIFIPRGWPSEAAMDHFQQTAGAILVAPGCGFESTEVYPAIHNSNTRKFRGGRLAVPSTDDHRFPEEVALKAVRRFMEDHQQVPTAELWAAAGLSPSEKTIRRNSAAFELRPGWPAVVEDGRTSFAAGRWSSLEYVEKAPQ